MSVEKPTPKNDEYSSIQKNPKEHAVLNETVIANKDETEPRIIFNRSAHGSAQIHHSCLLRKLDS